MEISDNLKKEFGLSNINREMFLDCFHYPIIMDEVSDEMMQKLADEVESTVRKKYPDVTDEMFRIWVKDEIPDEEIDRISVDFQDAWRFYWSTLYDLSIKFGGKIESNI